MKPRLSLGDRLAVGALATAAVLTFWLEGHPLETKAPTEAPLTLQGSDAPPGLRRTTEMEAHHCAENWLRGELPMTLDCNYMPVDERGNDLPIYEDDVYGRWNCATMGNRLCGMPRAVTRHLALTG